MPLFKESTRGLSVCQALQEHMPGREERARGQKGYSEERCQHWPQNLDNG